MKRYNKDILPFGMYCRAWRKRNGFTATDMAECIGVRNANDIYQFESGARASWYILSGYIKSGCDITFEMTRNANLCGDCIHFPNCSNYIMEDECENFERIESDDED